MKQLLLILLISHVLGDYYLQTDKLADAKDHDSKSLRIHLRLYGIPFLVMAVLHQFSRTVLLAGLLAVVCHAVIDLAKATLTDKKRSSKKDPGWNGRVYILDQSLHWLSLLIIAFIFRSDPAIPAWSFLNELVQEINLTWPLLLQWSLALLLIYRPSNITFTKLFSIYKPIEPIGETSDAAVSTGDKAGDKLRTGGIIGVLEKLLALIFLSVGEYMAIGLVLTAKSIARYDKISKSASFAEYYLIGTLSSIIMVLMIYVLCFQLLI